MGIEDKVNAALANELRVYARTRWPLANDKYRKSRLATLLDVSSRRIKSLWEGEDSAVVREHEAEAVRRLIGLKVAEEANRNDLIALQARIARLEAALFEGDEDFHRAQVDAFRRAAGLGRRADEPEGR